MNTSRNTSPAAESAVVPAGTRWGRSRFGGSDTALSSVSLITGALLACGLGWLATVFDADSARPLLLFVTVAVISLPFSVVLVWALLVDYSTLTGATRDPEASIESSWYDKAASGAFTDLLPVLGLGAAAFSFLDLAVSTGLVLAAVFAIAAVDFVLRYFLAKRADS